MSAVPGTAAVEWVWVPDRDWRTPSQYTRCRHSTQHPCPNPPVADLNRQAYTMRSGMVDRWYAYCAEHLYGRRLRDGVVELKVHPDSPAAKRGYA